jgi:hypothetical protein
LAFSFVQQDETIAQELNDLLQDRYSTFLYSRRQGEIAGKDGELRFNDIFGKESRAVIVLHRAGWGETPWTRIEETAIRNRAFDEGYDFALFIPTEAPASVPRWLPKTRIWYNLSRWGLEGAAPVIEAHIQSLGGEARVESVADRSARLERALASEQKRQQFLRSVDGVNAAGGEFDDLIVRLRGWAQEIAANLGVVAKVYGRALLLIRPFQHERPLGLTAYWLCQYANVLEDARIVVSLWDGHPDWPGSTVWDTANLLMEHKFHCDVGADMKLFWREQQGGRKFTTEDLADFIATYYMNEIQKRAVKER